MKAESKRSSYWTLDTFLACISKTEGRASATKWALNVTRSDSPCISYIQLSAAHSQCQLVLKWIYFVVLMPRNLQVYSSLILWFNTIKIKLAGSLKITYILSLLSIYEYITTANLRNEHGTSWPCYDVKSDINIKITNWRDCIRTRPKWKEFVEKAKTSLKL